MDQIFMYISAIVLWFIIILSIGSIASMAVESKLDKFWKILIVGILMFVGVSITYLVFR